jgi:hypothetical protein
MSAGFSSVFAEAHGDRLTAWLSFQRPLAGLTPQ